MSNLIPIASMKLSTASTPYFGASIEAGAGDIVHVGLLVESLNGAPTAASLSVKFQVRPIAFNGYSLNTESDGVARPWIDVAADGRLGHLLVGGDWPTSIADHTYQSRPLNSSGISSNTAFTGQPVLVERAIMVGALARQVRIVVSSTFTGGTSPSFTFTSTATVQPHFGA